MAVLYIFIAFMILLFMITVHEFGHYIAAKALKFRVEEFSVGIGKAIYKKKRKNGEVFSIRLIPLGGFCMFAGDDDLDNKLGDNRPKTFEKEEDKDYIPFNKQAPWKRLIVLFSGGFANLICAVIFAVVFLMVFGYHHNVKVTDLDPAVAHHQFQEGDIIQSIENKKGEYKSFTFTNSFMAQLNNYDKIGDTFTVKVLRDVDGNGVLVPVDVTATIQRVADDKGRYSSILAGAAGLKQQWIKLSFGNALGKAFVFTGELIWFMLTILGKLITGQLSIFAIGGPFTTVSIMSELAMASLFNILMLIPLISVNLGIFNLLPIPALDGSRMVFTGIEWARGRPINPNLEAKIHMIGLFVLLGLVLFLDIAYLFFR